MNKSDSTPFYAKTALISISFFALIYTLKIGQDIIVPIVYALILAILLNPIVNFFMRKMSRILAITLAVSLATVFLFTILYIITTQLTFFSHTFPQFQLKFNQLSDDLISWISSKFHLKISDIHAWINGTKKDVLDNLEIGKSISIVSDSLVTLLMLPVYLIMILYYKTLFLEFFRKLFRTEYLETVSEVLQNSKVIIQSYLVGLLVEMVIIAILNSVGLLILDIDYAILLGILGAILNIIPYLGGLIGVVIFMIIALVTKSPVYMMYVAILYSIIQFIDNNYIMPKIVASRVQINAFISVIVVFIGGAIWGLSGMFLSIPLTAIIKVIFDHIDSLKPWGYLLGNIVPTKSKLSKSKN
jgi:predicted PurR-regulated permease PerM